MKRAKDSGTLVALALIGAALFTAGCGKLKGKLGSTPGMTDGAGDGGSGPDSPDTPTFELGSFDLTINSYESCDALQADVRKQLVAMQESQKAEAAYWQSRYIEDGDNSVSAQADGAMAPESEKDAATPSDQITNVQEKGVDEADIAKLGTDHFYVGHAKKIEVMDRASLATLGAIDLGPLQRPTLYAEGNRLVVIGSEVSPGSASGCPAYGLSDYACAPSYGQATLVRVYAAEKGKMPVLANERRYEDRLVDSRFVNGKVILVFEGSLFTPTYGTYETEVPAAPLVVADGKVKGVECTKISKPYAMDLDFRLTQIITFDSRDVAKPDQLSATLGGGDQIYMTPTGIYIAKQGMYWTPFVTPESDGDMQSYYDRLQMLRETLIVTRIAFDADTGAVGAQAVGAVGGRVKDQWAFHEYLGAKALAIATTTWTKVKPETTTDGQHNHLWVLQQDGAKLVNVAAINDFGPREDIRAVRYMGNMAYVVTFEKTDPLFSFDMTNPVEPKALSELKIPGFSMYLHPTGDGRLVGVGYDADDQGDFSWFQGVQVSLFDVSNPLAMNRLDVKVLGDRGSYSDVTGDHKAFFEDRERHVIGLPVVEMKKSEGSAQGGSEQGQAKVFAGAILYDLSGDKLAERARLSHGDLISPDCAVGNDYHWWQNKRRSLDINRIYQFDDRLITVSRFGVRAHAPDHPDQTLLTTKFEPDASDCSTNEYDYWW